MIPTAQKCRSASRNPHNYYSAVGSGSVWYVDRLVRYCIDKNYGVALIIWDRLFGTFAEEREHEEIVYGTIEQKDNNHILGLQADSWRELWGRVVSSKTSGDALRTVMYGPGWSSGQPRLGNSEDLPDVTEHGVYSDHIQIVHPVPSESQGRGAPPGQPQKPLKGIIVTDLKAVQSGHLVPRPQRVAVYRVAVTP
ncbi:Alkylglycerol monooxygenase [Chionoecetes opilio]|uniref:Alkylglycerol monooxygenase n=1 Tax=Chionoecetes opilio TaxID=41210 RepID=A0A8J4YCF8_CHIOP|nr:Alkylglycerol monooxygenase [Chionoecetes opilio]